MDRATALKAAYKAGRRGGDSIARKALLNLLVYTLSIGFYDWLKILHLIRFLPFPVLGVEFKKN